MPRLKGYQRNPNRNITTLIPSERFIINECETPISKVDLIKWLGNIKEADRKNSVKNQIPIIRRCFELGNMSKVSREFGISSERVRQIIEIHGIPSRAIKLYHSKISVLK